MVQNELYVKNFAHLNIYFQRGNFFVVFSQYCQPICYVVDRKIFSSRHYIFLLK